ncbi:MAG TPA: MEKHLA domain-containing protein [Oxalicibacterium sp.]|uniref:MEKHLA domain-containing protein n=1 Tax=Oxalicibacterium sp. TaxID=2766525 RepID=UPI002CD0EAE6|nr:MEKHLA domain-containing protein [Oxalicibacterium sp.]HWU98510.1 MEKHLA domain-containing protein [Oxalicibacterium sp.]
MTSPIDPAFFDLLSASYQHFFNQRLVPFPVEDSVDAARWLYADAPFAVLAHNTNADPMFVYGNLAAQRRFGYSWDEITNLHSRLSAELPNREERQQLLDRVKRDGFARDYRGVRISKSGEKFLIEDAVLWQLIDAQGSVRGQAVKIMKTRDYP